MVLGLGGFEILDLDMPLLLSIDPIEGGYQYKGSFLYPYHEAGLGMFINADSSLMLSIE
jgi:hypothetical protein